MSSLNKVQIIGNTTADMELKETDGGSKYVKFSVATNRKWTNKTTGEKMEEVEFHNIIAWGRLAEILDQYVQKGHKIYCGGRMKTDSWEDKDSGKKMYRMEVVLEDMVMLQGKSEANGHQSKEPQGAAKSSDDLDF